MIPGVQRDWPIPAISGMHREAMKTADEAVQVCLNLAMEAARKEKLG